MNPLRFLRHLLALLLSSVILQVSTFADSLPSTPYVIPFQGRLTNQQGVAYATGQYTIVFNIYGTAVGGATAWT